MRACLPHVFQPVDREQIRGHGEVQLVDEGGHLGGGIQQVDDGATELAQFGLEGDEHLRALVGIGERQPAPRRRVHQQLTLASSCLVNKRKGLLSWFQRAQHKPRAAPSVFGRARILTGVTVSFFMAELYWRTDRSGSLLGKVSSGDLVAISQTPSYHSSGQSPGRERTSETTALAVTHCSGANARNS